MFNKLTHFCHGLRSVTYFGLLATTILTFVSIVTTINRKNIFWGKDAFVPRRNSTLHAYMDQREETLIIKHLRNFKSTIRGHRIVMLEYGSGSSTFVYSNYVHRYVSIEHSLNYCAVLKNMSISQGTHSITIFYAKSNGSGYMETNRFEKNVPEWGKTSPIEVYCIAPTESMLSSRMSNKGARSTYSMYQNYVDFVPIYLKNQLFDFVLVDGRARPQTAYIVLRHLNGPHAKVFVHDWNNRRAYHVIVKEFYNIVDQQIQSRQLRGGGLVVLEKKPNVNGEVNINAIQWKNVTRPSWWL